MSGFDYKQQYRDLFLPTEIPAFKMLWCVDGVQFSFDERGNWIFTLMICQLETVLRHSVRRPE